MGAYVQLGQSERKKWVPANPYCSLDDVLMELRKPASGAAEGTNDYNEIMLAIEHASRFIDRWRGRDFYQHDYTLTPLTFDDYSEQVQEDTIFLPYSPVISGLRLVQDGATLSDGADYRLLETARMDGSYQCKLVRMATAFAFTSNPWNFNRAGGNYLSVYGLFGFAQSTAEDVPTAMPDFISYAARCIAAAMSGHLRKEIITMDGNRDSIMTKEYDKIAASILGPKHGTILG